MGINLIPRLIALLVKYVTALAYAPEAYVLASYIVLMFVILIIIKSDLSEYRIDNPQKNIFVITWLLLSVTPAFANRWNYNDDIFLNLTHLQFFTGIALFFLIFEKPDITAPKCISILMLGLTGPFGVFILFIFIAKCLYQRSFKAPQFLIIFSLVIPALLQIITYLHSDRTINHFTISFKYLDFAFIIILSLVKLFFAQFWYFSPIFVIVFIYYFLQRKNNLFINLFILFSPEKLNRYSLWVNGFH